MLPRDSARNAMLSLHRTDIVVSRIALGAAHRPPVHAVAFRYQSMICRPCQNSVPRFAAM